MRYNWPLDRFVIQTSSTATTFTIYQKPIEEEYNGMHPSKIAFIMNEGLRAVIGKYEDEDHKETMFKTLDATLKAGDLCLVPSSTRWGFTVVKLFKVDVPIDFGAGAEVRWILSKVDKEGFEDHLKKENIAIEKWQ